MPSATKAHERVFLSGHAMGLFSAGFPTGAGVRLTLPRPTLRTGFPCPARGRPSRPLGGSTAHLQLFKSSTGHSSMQIANRLDSRAVSRLPENSNGARIAQPDMTVERRQFLWERSPGVHEIRAARPPIKPRFLRPRHSGRL